MRHARALDGSFTLLGGRFPIAVGIVVGLTLLGSILGAIGWRSGFPFLAHVGLAPDLVWHGQVWRLATWSFFELDPLSLIISCLVVLFFGRDLAYRWGGWRFLKVYVGLTVVTGVATCLVARLVWPALMSGAYHTSWPLVDAVVIAWATVFPGRQILYALVLPLGGKKFIYMTVGGTLIFALLKGLAFFVPHFIAQGLVLLYLRQPSPQYLWLRLKLAVLQRRPWRRVTHLRPVDRHQREDPQRWTH